MNLILNFVPTVFKFRPKISWVADFYKSPLRFLPFLLSFVAECAACWYHTLIRYSSPHWAQSSFVDSVSLHVSVTHTHPHKLKHLNHCAIILWQPHSPIIQLSGKMSCLQLMGQKVKTHTHSSGNNRTHGWAATPSTASVTNGWLAAHGDPLFTSNQKAGYKTPGPASEVVHSLKHRQNKPYR